MSNPWLSIDLGDYEGHMRSPGVQQLKLLAELFRRVLDSCRPESVALLGVAGGNGLEQIDCATTNRVVGIDINPRYLDQVRRRFGRLAGMELYCRDLAQPDSGIAPVALVHAALILEHAGLGVALENTLSLVAPGGHLSVVLKLPSATEQSVSPTEYPAMQTLREHFALIDRHELQRTLRRKGFKLVEQEERPASSGKALWLGVFAQSATGDAGKTEADRV